MRGVLVLVSGREASISSWQTGVWMAADASTGQPVGFFSSCFPGLIDSRWLFFQVSDCGRRFSRRVGKCVSESKAASQSGWHLRAPSSRVRDMSVFQIRARVCVSFRKRCFSECRALDVFARVCDGAICARIS